MGQPAVGREDVLCLAVLHVWTHAPNPVGPFATDNWTLPLRRVARFGAVVTQTPHSPPRGKVYGDSSAIVCRATALR